MFEQHDRWLEELLEYTNRKESVTCTSGCMPLPAIAQEIATACADNRQHDGKHKSNWQSMASDLSDSLDWIGPELRALVDVPAQAIHHAITNDLLVTRPSGGTVLDDTKRPVVAARTAALTGILDRDDLLVAAWRDLVSACRDTDHTRYPNERIAFLRDTLFGLNEYRKQDRGYWSPISTAVQVLLGNPTSVEQAQEMVGDNVDITSLIDPHAEIDLTEDELSDLAERCIVRLPVTGKYVVWFRLHPAFVKSVACVTHGDVTFYDAQTLAGALTDHQRARELFDVVPEELLTDEVRDLQLLGKVDDCVGFEYAPQLVYARVTVHDVERHHAVDAARTHLDTVLAVVGVNDGMWTVLDGILFFDDEPSYFPPAQWGLKEPLPEPVFYENDYFTTHLTEITAKGHAITAEAAQRVQPALRLQAALASAPRSDPEATVMAAVRAIEHCNTWTAPLGGLHWNEFIDQYLLDEYSVTAFAKRVVHDPFAAVEQHRPDRTPGAATPPELEAIRQDITVPGWSLRIDSLKTTSHMATLDHWLARRLSETDDILSTGAALSGAFDAERRRVGARVKRLTRSRNAAIHGGLCRTWRAAPSLTLPRLSDGKR